jgi:hypothetical protein
MRITRWWPAVAVAVVLSLAARSPGQVRTAPATAPADLPPGWLPVHRLDDAPAYADFRKVDDRVHLDLPPGVDTVRGVFVCYVFHSSDPRELARLWRFALVTVPTPFEYDLGYHDKRNARSKLGHPLGDTSVLLRYLDAAARETNHPELAVAPIVGWVGQNGARICADLYKRAPDRVLAWADAWYKDWPNYPDLIAHVPVASAWEYGKKEREAEATAAGPVPPDKPTPPADLRCYASTYGFPHGIYSKYGFFVAYLDRCIALRLPAETPPAGQPVKLRPVDLKAGWAGDYLPVGQWNPIAPYAEAKGMAAPQWMPDAYAAWTWRAYHSANPDLKITGPVLEYRKKDGKWGGPECGLGYGNVVKPGTPLAFSAEVAGAYARVEFHDGDRVVGTASAAPWTVENVKLDRGLHALFAVGVTADGKRTASRPGFLVVD